MGIRTSVGLALASAALVAGCGSSSRPLTRAELIAKANAICRRVVSEVDWPKVTPATFPAVADHLAALEERAAEELNKLTPPNSMLGEWRLIVDGFKLTGPEFRSLGREVSGGPEVLKYLPLSNAQHERGLDAKLAGIHGCEKY